jgi:hypothetical protein
MHCLTPSPSSPVGKPESRIAHLSRPNDKLFKSAHTSNLSAGYTSFCLKQFLLGLCYRATV